MSYTEWSITRLEWSQIDGKNVAELQKLLHDLMENGKKRIILDMSNVTFISSFGLGALIAVSQDLGKTRGKLCLVKLTPHLQKLLSHVNLLGILGVHATADEAIANYPA